MLAYRDLQLRYRQTIFGVLWAVLQPLVAMAIFSGIFGSLARLPSNHRPYPVFVLTGLAAWFFVSTAVSQAAESLVAQPDLVSKVWFPRLLAPAAAVLAATIDLAISIVLVAIAMAAYGVAPDLAILTLPLWIVAAIVLAAAVGFWLSAANVLYRDVRYALPFVLQVWFFASPVVFPEALLHGGWRWVFALNPMAGVIDGFRWALIRGPAPGPSIVVSGIALIAVLAGGVFYFRLAERSFADRI